MNDMGLLVTIAIHLSPFVEAYYAPRGLRFNRHE
jgi:hypothetical protein